MFGFTLDIWDYLTFLTLFLTAGAVVSAWVWLAGLPGRIAIARKHPDAEAVNLMGWAGLLPTIYPWVQAFVWAFKPTEIVDIRRFPRDEQRAIDEDIARLGGGKPAAARASPRPPTPSAPLPPSTPRAPRAPPEPPTPPAAPQV